MRRGYWGLVFIALACLASVASKAADEQACASLAFHSPGCDIKGMISTNGERHYVLPSDNRYSNICVEATSERYFCNVVDAWDHGWRPIPAAVPPTKAECRIIGNIGRNDFGNETRIYHVPKSTYYARVVFHDGRDKWFCSIKEAVAAGFRAPYR